MSAGPHSHPFHLPIPGVLGHSLLMHGVHGLREERSAHICAAPPGFDPPSAPAEPGGGLCVELLVLRPRGTHLGVRTWSTCRSPSYGDPFGVLTSSTRCTSGSFSYGEPTLGSSSPAPGAHLGHPPMGTHLGSSPPAPGAHLGHPPMGNPMWGPHLQHPVHIWVTLQWGTHFGGPHLQHPAHIWVTLQWGTHFGGPHLQHPVHIWVAHLRGSHFGVLISSTRCTFGSSSYGEPNVGPSSQAPTARIGHRPMGNPFWGSSRPAPGAF